MFHLHTNSIKFEVTAVREDTGCWSSTRHDDDDDDDYSHKTLG